MHEVHKLHALHCRPFCIWKMEEKGIDLLPLSSWEKDMILRSLRHSKDEACSAVTTRAIDHLCQPIVDVVPVCVNIVLQVQHTHFNLPRLRVTLLQCVLCISSLSYVSQPKLHCRPFGLEAVILKLQQRWDYKPRERQQEARTHNTCNFIVISV